MNAGVFTGGIVFGAALGALVGIWVAGRSREPAGRPGAADYSQVLDLLRRLHQASVACLILDDTESTISTGDPRPDTRLVDRCVATARLAMGDRRQHVVHGDAEMVALGDAGIGAAVAFNGNPGVAAVDRAADDLRRLIAGARVQLVGTAGQGDPRRAFERALASLDSIESLSTALCESARRLSDQATAVVLRDPVTQVATVSAVSRAGDRKLIGLRVSADSAAGRASMGEIPVVGLTHNELLGPAPDSGRRRGDSGVAYPLHDGRTAIGALIVFGPPERVPPEMRERIAALGSHLSPHMAAAVAVRAAENRAVTDELTGLPNRRALERALRQVSQAAAFLMVDVDHFKRLNDTHGHPAGDAALKLLAQVFQRTLREGDLAARVGGEEFGMLLHGASEPVATEVAERIRQAVEGTALRWAGGDIRLTCSIGIAVYPDPIRDAANLLAAADAALYRAKEAGRNRVVSATPAASPSR